MLIRTVEELDQAHTPWAVVIDERSQAWQEAGTLTDEDKTENAWVTYSGLLTSQQLFTQSEHLTLIHPRRYGDEDVERVKQALIINLNHSGTVDYLDNLARAALDALEGK